MSSPSVPLPRVNASASSPRSYRRLIATPSIFGSQTIAMPPASRASPSRSAPNSDSSGASSVSMAPSAERPNAFSIRFTQSRTSSAEYELSIDSIGTLCFRVTNPSIGSPPTRFVGLVGSSRPRSASSFASSASFSSYSRSERNGAAST